MKQQSLIFGIHPLLELLKNKRRVMYKLYTLNPKPKAFSSIQQLLAKRTELVTVTRTQLNDLCESTDHQGFAAVVGSYPFRTTPFQPATHPFIVLLDGIQDPRNMGAIIRSAYCTGVDGIVLPEKQSSPLSGTVLKAAAGLTERIDLYQPASSIAAIAEIKKAGYHIYLATLNGANSSTTTYETPTCLVIGNEATGISSSLLSQGTAITIPQKTPDVSYNASVAAGILLFTISAQRKKN